MSDEAHARCRVRAAARVHPLAAAAAATLAACLAAAAACDGDSQPPPVTTCDGLCDLTPDTTPEQDLCVRTVLGGLGHAMDTTPQCLGFTSAAGCDICFQRLGPVDEECAAAWSACYR
ncbi:MAG: hypothetical protein HY907_22960 [Deltaproteobacteria bacterium]|nr:hypothetical protein [Deltaproteobacteria bacterium]